MEDYEKGGFTKELSRKLISPTRICGEYEWRKEVIVAKNGIPLGQKVRFTIINRKAFGGGAEGRLLEVEGNSPLEVKGEPLM